MTDCMGGWLVAGWLVGWFDWTAGLWIRWLVSWLDGWFIGWLAGHLLNWVGGWLFGDWLVGLLTGWQVAWLIGWVISWLYGDDWLAVWLVGWLLDKLVGMLGDRSLGWLLSLWLAGRLIGWMVSWLIGWMISWVVSWLKELPPSPPSISLIHLSYGHYHDYEIWNQPIRKKKFCLYTAMNTGTLLDKPIYHFTIYVNCQQKTQNDLLFKGLPLMDVEQIWFDDCGDADLMKLVRFCQSFLPHFHLPENTRAGH